MMEWTVAALVEATGGKLLQGNPARMVGSASTDTRSLKYGDCFIALPGERFDGHRFIGQAVSAGAAVLVVSNKPPVEIAPAPNVAVIEVPDTLRALGDIARFHRARHTLPIFGISGSNGKTSTKEMLAGILARNRKVLKNAGNLNNLIGVPLTLLGINPEHDVAVIEMGISVPGEMERLAAMTSPTSALITNIHPAHLEGLGSLEGILAEKSKLWTRVEESGGQAVVNLDDSLLEQFAAGLNMRKVTYSLSRRSADVCVQGGVSVQDGASSMILLIGGERVEVRLPVLGMHHVRNAVAAAAAAFSLGESPLAISEGLAAHQPVKQRMQMHRLPSGATLVDDTYNANPGSMLAAIRTVTEAGRGKPVIAVLGDMKELGPGTAALHRELGRELGSMGLCLLVAVGEMGAEMIKGAREAGMKGSACRHVPGHNEAVGEVLSRISGDAWVLVKGSRSMAMEKVVEGVLGK